MEARWRRGRLITQLGIGQTIGYASSYYLPAVLAGPLSADLGISYSTFYGFFTGATLLGVFLGPAIGRWVDRTTSHRVLPLSTGFFALGLAIMATSNNLILFGIGWMVLSLGGALGLYDVAFATVVRLEPDKPRHVIAGITLIAGFASSIGWPLTSLITDLASWRWALGFWAITHIVICLPLYLFLPRLTESLNEQPPAQKATSMWSVRIDTTLILFGLMLSAGGFIQGAMGLHLIPILEASWVNPSAALWAATLLGPGQVLARLLQVVVPKFFEPRLISALSLSLHAIAVVLFWVLGPGFAPVFAFLHGMGSGFYTVAVATLPLQLYGSKNYGERQGFILVLSRLVMVVTPFGYSLAVVSLGTYALGLTASASVIGLVLLALLLARFDLRHEHSHEIRDPDPVTIESGPIDIPDERRP